MSEKPTLTAIGVNRHESGSGVSFRVWFTVVIEKSDGTEQAMAGKHTGDDMHRMFEKFRIPYNVFGPVLRNAGTVEWNGTSWQVRK